MNILFPKRWASAFSQRIILVFLYKELLFGWLQGKQYF